MPCTEAQKRAAKKWRENNREEYKRRISEWRKEFPEAQNEYARKSMAKKYLWKCAVRDLFRCLYEGTPLGTP
jgi:hypothetical protein